MSSFYHIQNYVHWLLAENCYTSTQVNNADGRYAYLPTCLSRALSTVNVGNSIKLCFGFDGVKIYESSKRSFWVLVLTVRGTRLKFAVSLFCGSGHPCRQKMFAAFVEEYNQLKVNGIRLENGVHLALPNTGALVGLV